MTKKQEITNLKNTVRHYFKFKDQKWIKDRKYDCIFARNIFVYILRNDFELTFSKIGEIIERSKSSAIYINNLVINNYEKYKKDIEEIRNKIN